MVRDGKPKLLKWEKLWSNGFWTFAGYWNIGCRELYKNWLKTQKEPVPEEDRLAFSNCWVRNWCNEYNVSLRNTNKRFAISSKEDRIERLLDYFKNVWMVRKYFIHTYGVNGDKKPLHRTEAAMQKTVALKNESTYVKENYMLSRDCKW